MPFKKSVPHQGGIINVTAEFAFEEAPKSPKNLYAENSGSKALIEMPKKVEPTENDPSKVFARQLVFLNTTPPYNKSSKYPC